MAYCIEKLLAQPFGNLYGLKDLNCSPLEDRVEDLAHDSLSMLPLQHTSCCCCNTDVGDQPKKRFAKLAIHATNSSIRNCGSQPRRRPHAAVRVDEIDKNWFAMPSR
jgi:hypothetical protein